MISKNLETLLNQQMMLEFYASNIYLQVAASFYKDGFHGFYEYMKKQSEEERGHGLKIFKFLLCNGAQVNVGQVSQADLGFGDLSPSVFGILKLAYDLEVKVSASINGMMREANLNEDYAVVSFLQWFVDEQVQEEKDALLLMQKAEMIGDDKTGMLALDSEIEEEMEEELTLDDIRL
jgi:ferritin